MKRPLFLFSLAFMSMMNALAEPKLIPSSATPPYDQQPQDNGVRLSMTFSNEPLVQALKRLEANSQYRFLFTYDDVASHKVNQKFHNARFFEILDAMLRGTGLTYKVDGKLISISRRDGKQPTQQGQIQSVGGHVYDKATGEPIIGAQVRVVGADNVGAVTDLNGAFTFEYMLGGEQEVQVSYVGMKTKVVPVTKNMRIMLESDTQQLSDVVVTGIFRKAKESYTGSVSTITEDQLDLYKGQNLLQTLKNVDASLNFQIDNTNGSNPNNLPSINIRGNASVPTDLQQFNETQKNTVNTPLIILDGFEISLEKLMDYNDDEIQSINILKDAAATAIYGSRGANGVIVVVTKEPEAGHLRVNAEVGLTMEIPDLTSYNLLDAEGKFQLEEQVRQLTASAYDSPTQSAERNRRLKNVLRGINTDWLSKPLHTGVGSRYNARLEGGSDEFRWSTSLAYTNTQGAMKGSERRNFNGAITLLYRMKNLTFRNYTSIGVNRSRESKYGDFSEYVRLQPYESPYNDDGSLVKNWTYYTVNGSYVGNPLYDAQWGSFDKSGYESIINNFSIEWTPLDGLILRGKFGISTQTTESDAFLSPYDSYFENDEFTTEEGLLRKGSYDYSLGRSYSLEGELTASYAKTFAEKHQLYAGLDFSLSQARDRSYIFQMEGFDSDNITNLTTAQQYAKDTSPSGSYSFYRMLGFTGNVNYTYDERYYVDLSYRIDGNSNYGSDKKWAPFWSAGIGWSLHNEKWLKGNPVISYLRLKASYGQTGTQLSSSTGAVTTYQYLQGEKYLGWSAAEMTGLGNTKLTWQTTDELNVGVEWGLWQNRFKGTFEVYTKKTSDMLSYMDLPSSMGFSSYLANVGEVKNNGFELSASYYIIRNPRKQLNWMVSGQLMYNKNEITKLSEDIKAQNEKYLSSNSDVELANLLMEGYPQNAIYGVRSLGIDPSTGEEIYLDKDGNPTSIWSVSNMVYLGQTDPKYRGIISTLFNWKGWTLNLSFAYRWGGQVYNATLRDRVEVTSSTILNQNVDERVLSQRWYQAGDVVAFKAIDNVTSKATSRYVMDDNVLALQSASLQYRWDNSWVKNHLGMQSVIFAINASDLFEWSSVKLERGTSYPYARNVQGSVKIMF